MVIISAKPFICKEQGFSYNKGSFLNNEEVSHFLIWARTEQLSIREKCLDRSVFIIFHFVRGRNDILAMSIIGHLDPFSWFDGPSSSKVWIEAFAHNILLTLSSFGSYSPHFVHILLTLSSFGLYYPAHFILIWHSMQKAKLWFAMILQLIWKSEMMIISTLDSDVPWKWSSTCT